MYKEWNVTIPALTGDEERMACVYVPDSYLENENRRYPVLYMFDAHNLVDDSKTTFGNSWRILEYMTREDIPLIIAAVDCNRKTEGEPYGWRLSEYAPFDYVQPQLGEIKGRGDITMDYFINVFKPYIDENYPTLPGRENTILAGSSMGGLIALYGVSAYNHVFQRSACLSPSLWVCPRKVLAMIAKSKMAPDTVIYMDYGQLEMGNHKENPRILRRTVSLLMKKKANLAFRIIQNGNHSEASWEKQIPVFMECLGL